MLKTEFRHLWWLLHRSSNDAALTNNEAFRTNKAWALSVFLELTMNNYLAKADDLAALEYAMGTELKDGSRTECNGAILKAAFDLNL